jgi:peroxiredoxin
MEIEMNLGLALALTSLLLVAGAAIWTNVTGRPLPSGVERGIAFAGTLLAGAALVSHPGAVGFVIAGIAFALGGFFSFLTFMSGLPAQQAAVAVGSNAPDFRSLDADGREFRLSELSGSRVLLKFFRGTWCPYCVADLRLWNEQRGELRALGLTLVAVSHDTVEDLQQFKRKHGWDVKLVADPALEIIRRYNLQNHNFTPKGGPFRDMAIPASILIDTDGKVLWMSQATDFRVRQRPAKVLAAVRAALHGRAKAGEESPRRGYSEIAQEEM